MVQAKVKLIIADTLVTLESRFPLEKINKGEENYQFAQRFNSFLYQGNKNTDILINIEIVDKLPQPKKVPTLFVGRYPHDRIENWRLFKKGNIYIYTTPRENKPQAMFVNNTFDRVTAYLLPNNKKGSIWNFLDIIYDFLQVLLINYFAQRKSGIFTHAMGIRDLDGRGFLFAGRSGYGKSTSARIWHKHSRAMVLNDDRIVVRKIRGKFLIYGSPWYGDFRNYLTFQMESAPLRKLFFIYHSSKNKVRPLSSKEAFMCLYPAIFPTFWDRRCLENIISFCQNLVNNVECLHLGFVKDKSLIGFVRNIDNNLKRG